MSRNHIGHATIFVDAKKGSSFGMYGIPRNIHHKTTSDKQQQMSFNPLKILPNNKLKRTFFKIRIHFTYSSF